MSGVDQVSSQAEYDRLVALGQAVEDSMYSLNATFPSMQILSIARLQQSGQSWSNNIMQTYGSTIGKSGCALTGFTMIQRYYGGTDDPGQVNKTLGNAACPLAYATAASHYNLTVSINLSTTTGLNTNLIKGAISENKPILIGMKYGANLQYSHFVVIYGYAYDKILIRDPASTNHTMLSEYLDNGYILTKVVVFTK